MKYKMDDPRWEPGFKLLQDTRMSWATFIPNSLKYPRGEIVVRPEGFGPMAVFFSKKDLLRFTLCRTFSGLWAIHEMAVPCLFIQSSDVRLWQPDYNEWGGPRVDPEDDVYHISNLPEGTRLADAVLCLE